MWIWFWSIYIIMIWFETDKHARRFYFTLQKMYFSIFHCCVVNVCLVWTVCISDKCWVNQKRMFIFQSNQLQHTTHHPACVSPLDCRHAKQILIYELLMSESSGTVGLHQIRYIGHYIAMTKPLQLNSTAAELFSMSKRFLNLIPFSSFLP